MFKSKKDVSNQNSNQENSKISIADELDKLSQLKEKGILSDLEFEKEKDKLLNGAKFQAQQPTFIIQNSASSSSSAAATAVVKRSGCLSSIIKGVIALFVLFLVLDYMVWSAGDKAKSKATSVETNVSANQPSTKTETLPEVKQLISDKQCNQIIKDLVYHTHIQDACFVEMKLDEFDSNLERNNFMQYSLRNGCPLINEDVAYKLQEETSLAFAKTLRSSPNKAEFCKKELPYFQKVVQKYQ